MKSLAEFFGKFRHLQPPERAIKRAACAACRDVLGVELSSDQINVVRGTLYINAPSVMKSEIKLHERDLIASINGALAPSKRRISQLR